MKPQYWFEDDEGRIYFLDYLNDNEPVYHEVTKVKKLVKEEKKDGTRVTY